MKLNKNIAISESGFIFNPSSGDSFSSNEIGSEILQLLKADKSTGEIVKAVAVKYDVDAVAFEKDLEDFMVQLRDNNLSTYEG